MELPARFLEDMLDAARECGVEIDRVLEGFDLSRLRSRPGGRVGWNDFAEITDRVAAALGTNDRVEELGRLSVARASTWALFHLVPHVVGPGLVLRIGMQFSGPLVFPHMRHRTEKRPGGTLRLTLSLPAPYQSCEAFFRASAGGIRSMPTLFGYKPALLVVVAIGPRGCVFDVTPPPHRTFFGRVQSAVRALRSESALFEEVARQHEASQEVFGMLLRTKSELHELMERVPDPLLVHRDGVVLWTNQALLVALKCASLDDLRGKRLIDLVHPADRDAAARRLATPVGEARVATIRVRVADGSFRTLEFSEPQTVIFEELPARMAAARDVTERDALRDQLVLADRMSQLGFLAAGVAHEINNPLAYALAALDKAQEDLRAGRLDGLSDSLAIAREGAERVRGISGDLRMFTRGGEQRADVVDLGDVLRATADLTAANIRTRGRLTVDLRPTPVLLADAGRLGQVFMNLLVNAIDALKHGDPAKNHIAIRAFTDADGAAVVEVEDNGIGIPPDVRPHIFDPFFTTKGPRSGSGLGLAICHRIVTDLGGRIEADETSGTGALFRVILLPHTGELPPPAPRPKSAPRLRVLVVDDEPPLAAALGRMLEDEHDVEVVTSGEAALQRLGGGASYDAILCDLMMADVGGMDVYGRLSSERPALARRLVFMTGGVFSEKAQRFLGAVKNPCLDKPFTKEEAIGAMNQVRGLE